jgi:hypothetical protein
MMKYGRSRLQAFKSLKIGRGRQTEKLDMKTHFILWGIAGFLFGAGLSSDAQDADKENPPTLPRTNNARLTSPSGPVRKDGLLMEKLKTAAANLSPSIIEIAKMSDAGTDPAIVQAFVESSPVAYTLRAEEIIYLHDHGVSGAIITAMIQHGAKLREQGAAAQANAAYQAATSQPPPPPAATYPVEAASPAYAASPTYVAPAYYPSYAYPYPAYWYAPYPGFGIYYSRPFYHGRSFGVGSRFSPSFRSGHSFGHTR